ncbi:hypothetical protein ACFPK5_03240 [Streptomyces beijiangensis]|uniref:hypothetical protein n=1 Tax=Streptomyces beijiangensis TaxID=163361 RepID=UPI003608B0BD
MTGPYNRLPSFVPITPMGLHLAGRWGAPHPSSAAAALRMSSPHCPRLTAELSADEYCIAAVLHPNTWPRPRPDPRLARPHPRRPAPLLAARAGAPASSGQTVRRRPVSTSGPYTSARNAASVTD